MQILSICHEHKLALTEREHIELVPHCALVEDRIAHLLEASVPFVLRATGGLIGSRGKKPMQLIGDAYIHGFMNGEGMNFQDFAPQEIRLR